jgi:hypothetical protein
MKCECGRGDVVVTISARKANTGELLDEMSLCRECLQENAVIRAFDALGINPGEGL